MTVVGLEPEQEPHAGHPANRDLVREVLTGHSPVFFQVVDDYPKIIEEAMAARQALAAMADLPEPPSRFVYDKEREYYLDHGRTEPDDPRVVAFERYVRRDELQERVSIEQDDLILIRKEGNTIVAELKQALDCGTHTFGGNIYCFEPHSDQATYPDRFVFYRVDAASSDGPEVTFPEFGDSFRYPVMQPFRRAGVDDIVQLVNDLRASVDPSQLP